MAKIISLVILLAAFSFAFLPVTYSDCNLIQTTCKQTPFFNLCDSTLESDTASYTSNVANLAFIVAQNVSAKATATLNQITGLLKTAKDPGLQKALQGCAGLYHTIVKEDIPAAINGIVKGRPQFAVDNAAYSALEALACEQRFANPPKAPISDSNKAVHDLLLVLQSIASLLLKG